nr:extracellular solute-binding protein [uncultured Oscillibacter sp.]
MDASASSNEEWKAKVLTDFQTGTEPDVLFFFTNADAEPFIQAGKVVDLATIRVAYPSYADNMRDSMMAVAQDGKTYAVPSSGFWENMFVNAKVLADCGVAVPGPDYAWDQFLQDCETIKAKGYAPIACSLFEVPHYWFEFTVMNNGTLESQLDVPASAAAGQKWVAALNDIKDLYERGYFPVNTLTATDAETVQIFADGDAAFLIDGSWKVNYFVDNYGDQLEDYAISYVPAKGDRTAGEAIGGISMGCFITKRAWDDPAKQKAAVEFIQHMTSDDVMSAFVTTEVTALKNGASPSGLKALQQSAADANANITGVIGAVQDTVSGECKADLFANVQNVVTGKMTAEDAVNSAVALNRFFRKALPGGQGFPP